MLAIECGIQRDVRVRRWFSAGRVGGDLRARVLGDCFPVEWKERQL